MSEGKQHGCNVFRCNYRREDRSNHYPRQEAAPLWRPQQGEVEDSGAPGPPLLGYSERTFYDQFCTLFGLWVNGAASAFVRDTLLFVV